MIELTPFRNSDSPGIAEVWNDQPPLRGRIQILTTALFEQHVLSKPYFDPRGLVIARQSGRTVGFVHAGFSPGTLPGELCFQDGVICQLVVAQLPDASEIASRLLETAESYLRTMGATKIYGGGYAQLSPFYLGLYGGCRMPGVLVDDNNFSQALGAGGYVPDREAVIWQRELSNFRPPVDRELVATRRQFQVRPESEFINDCWRETCDYCWIDRIRFEMAPSGTGTCCGSLTFWDMEPLASNWRARAMGLADVTIPSDSRGGCLLACLLSEAMRQLQTQGISLVEVQTGADDRILVEACSRLGFKEIDRGIQFRK